MSRNYLRLILIILALAIGLVLANGCATHIRAAETNDIPAQAKTLNDAAYALMQQGNDEAALPKCQEAVRLAPNYAEAQKNLALAFYDLGRAEEALAPGREAVSLNPRFDKAHFVLGKILFGLGQYQDSIRELKEAVRLNGNYDKAYYKLGAVYNRLNDMEAAVQALQQAVRIKPEEQSYQFALNLAHLQAQHFVKPNSQMPAPEVDPTRDNYALGKYAAQIRDYLYHEEFDSLDRIADVARTTKARFPGGDWKLEIFYRGVSRPEDDPKATNTDWQYHIGKIKKWIEQKPASITARVGLAEAYVEYGWRARGSGYASTVTEEGSKLFQERLAMAETVLTDARKLGVMCPQWYSVMQTIALGQGWGTDRYNKLFEEATKFEPLYYTYYEFKAIFLLPRWYGQSGDWERFADSTAQRVGGKEGSIIYYLIAMDMANIYKEEIFGDKLISETKVSWPQIKQGFADLAQVYGTSIHGTNQICSIAVLSVDKPFSRQLFARIGDNWDPWIWRIRENFETLKAWANDK